MAQKLELQKLPLYAFEHAISQSKSFDEIPKHMPLKCSWPGIKLELKRRGYSILKLYPKLKLIPLENKKGR